MKKIICMFAIVLAAFLGGCGAGTGQTSAEVDRAHKNVMKVGQRQLNDDLNSLFHADKPSRLSEKYIR